MKRSRSGLHAAGGRRARGLRVRLPSQAAHRQHHWIATRLQLVQLNQSTKARERACIMRVRSMQERRAQPRAAAPGRGSLDMYQSKGKAQG